MTKSADVFTAIIKRSVDVLFVLNPRGTSVGAFAGVLLEGLVKLFAPLLRRFNDVVDVSDLKTYYFIAGGVVVFNVPTLFKRRELPKEIEDAFETIRRTKPHMSAVQIKMQYLALCSDVIARVQLAPQGRTGRRKT